jgi:hypothetical protein
MFADMQMSSIKSIVAGLAGASVFGTACFAGRMASQYRKIFDDFGATLPSISVAFISPSFDAYLVLGLLCGALVSFVIWIAEPAWLSWACALSVAFGLLLFWAVFTAALALPLANVVQDVAAAAVENDSAAAQDESRAN